jgi:hypothetical protein
MTVRWSQHTLRFLPRRSQSQGRISDGVGAPQDARHPAMQRTGPSAMLREGDARDPYGRLGSAG